MFMSEKNKVRSAIGNQGVFGPVGKLKEGNIEGGQNQRKGKQRRRKKRHLRSEKI